MCWNAIGLHSVISKIAPFHDTVSAVFFSVLDVLNASDGVAWRMTLWSLSQSQNQRVWENKSADTSTIISVGNKFFMEMDWSPWTQQPSYDS